MTGVHEMGLVAMGGVWPIRPHVRIKTDSSECTYHRVPAGSVCCLTAAKQYFKSEFQKIKWSLVN